MSETSELRECECGSRGIIEVRQGTRVWYECYDCGRKGPVVDFIEVITSEARRLWNERTENHGE